MVHQHSPSRLCYYRNHDAASRTIHAQRPGRVDFAAGVPPYGPQKLGSMNLSARRSMRNGLHIDFVFMPFFCGLSTCLSIFARHTADKADGWDGMPRVLCWMPLCILLCDLLENSTGLGLLVRFEEKGEVRPGTVLLMAISSCAKWSIGIVWLLLILSHGISRAIEHWHFSS